MRGFLIGINMKEINNSIWNDPFEITSWRCHHGLFGPASFDVINFIKVETEKFFKELKPCSRILDLGSGANNRDYFVSSINTTDIICLDSSFGMLNCNEAKNKIQAEAKILPIKSDTIDLCVSIFLLRYLLKDDWTLLLKEIQRVLKQNAQFVIIDLEENNYKEQLSVFNPNLLVEVAAKTGFVNLAAHSENKKLSFRVNLGGYRGEEIHTYTIGVVTGQK